jgi:hypothetical protein
MQLKGAVRILQTLTDTDEERQALARRLDELIAEADRKAHPKSSKDALDQVEGLFDWLSITAQAEHKAGRQ